jgi:hypothetical protein
MSLTTAIENREPSQFFVSVRDVVLPIAVIFLLSRAALLLVAVLITSQVAGVSDATFASYFCHFDCGWYLSVADHGYSTVGPPTQPGATNFGFFPVFPLLVHGISSVLGSDTLYTAIIVANLCTFLGLIVVYNYALLLHHDKNVALLAVALLCVIPGSFAFSTAYSEGPFLLLLATSVFALRREQYLVAGVAAALLSATRPQGVFFLVFAIVAALQVIGWRGLLAPWKTPERFVPIVLAPLGLFCFLAYCFQTTGDAFAHTSTEVHGWGYYFGPPWQNVGVMLRMPGAPRLAVLYSFAILGCSWLLIRQRLHPEFFLTATLIVLMWSSQTTGSIFRYWVVLFPLWVALARVLADRRIALFLMFLLLALLNGLQMCAWTLSNILAI